MLNYTSKKADPNAHGIRPDEIDPEWAAECFLARALDTGNSQAGFFALAFGVMSFAHTVKEIYEKEEEKDRIHNERMAAEKARLEAAWPTNVG